MSDAAPDPVLGPGEQDRARAGAGPAGSPLDGAGARDRLLAFLLLAAGVAFRVWAVGYARFTGDESYFWATARQIARLEAAPAFGPPMTGSAANHPGPIFYYLMALPQLLGASPRLGGIFVALLHGTAAYLVYRLAREARGARAGLVALALLVFAPWDVLYADRIWLSCVAPVWGTAAIYAAHRAPRSPAWQGAFVFLALVCPQLHMSAPIVWVLAAVLIYLSRPVELSVRAAALGVLASVVAYAPAIVREVSTGFANTVAILTKGTGSLDAAGMMAAPLRVLGYAVLYGSSEIGYHFARGYWSPFDEARLYATAAGWRSYLELHGALWSAANVVSVLVAAVSWGLALASAGRALLAARRARAPGAPLALPLENRLTLGLAAALVAAAALMVGARKEYFPHYTNLLMPVALWPIVLGLDRALARARAPRIAAIAIAGVVVAAMASSAIRYYREVDGLNGLDATAGMVERVIGEGTPIRLEFEGFQNGFAWEMLANVGFRHPLSIRGDAPVRFRVKNASPSRGPAPPGTIAFGPVLLQRSPRQ